MVKVRYLSAQEAARELDISLPTLYAYVSRGLIRSEAAGGGKRSRRYNAEDVQRLKDRKAARHHPEKLAERALHFGTPLLDSALTLIEDGRLFYRGLNACQLAQSVTFEQVASLLWMGDTMTTLPAVGLVLPPQWEKVRSQIAGWPLFEQFQVLLPLAAAGDAAAYDLRSTSVIQTGARILELLMSVTMGEQTPGSIAERLAQTWCPDKSGAATLLNAALILCADHELNISSFTARCVASAGSTPYAAVSAGLCALQGTKHGGNTSRVEALMREVGQPAQSRQVIADRLRRGEAIPGFGHPLYPQGDPRAAVLLNMLSAQHELELPLTVAQTVMDLIGEPPNIDFALVALSYGLGLPPGTPLVLFALGRTAGWIGHLLEQYATDRLIRPRARYVGALPER